MATLIALLRGINVGRAKRVGMAQLRALVESLGYRDVRTLVNSGNIIFESSDQPNRAASRIEAEIREQLGFSSRVTVLTAAEVGSIASQNELAERATDLSRLLVAVLNDPASLACLTPLADQDWGAEALVLGSRAAYIWCPDGILASRLPEAVGRALGDGVTTRNWATFMKLHALVR